MHHKAPDLTGIWLAAGLFFVVVFALTSLSAADPVDAMNFARHSVAHGVDMVVDTPIDPTYQSAAELYEGAWSIQASGDSIVFVHHR